MKKDYGNVLLWAAVAVGAPRWAGAMLSADIGELTAGLSKFLNYLNVGSGLAMGVLEVLAVMYMFDGLRRQKPTTRIRNKTRINIKWWGVLFFACGILALTPAIIAPYIMARMNSINMIGVLSTWVMQLIWSVLVAASPVFIVGGVAFATQMVATATQDGGSAKASYPRRCSVPGCDYVADNRFAYSAHMKSHKESR